MVHTILINHGPTVDFSFVQSAKSFACIFLFKTLTLVRLLETSASIELLASHQLQSFAKILSRKIFRPQLNIFRWKLFLPEDTNQHHLKTTSSMDDVWIFERFQRNEFSSKLSYRGSHIRSLNH